MMKAEQLVPAQITPVELFRVDNKFIIISPAISGHLVLMIETRWCWR